MPNVLSCFRAEQPESSAKQAVMTADSEAGYNAKYPTAIPQWSFTLSITLDRPVDEVAPKLGRLDAFEKVSKLNPVCIEYTQIARDWIIIPTPLADSRVREVPACIATMEDKLEVLDGIKYERVHFRSKETLRAFWGLLTDVTSQRGTYVWDEEGRVGLWEVATSDKPGLEAWLKKVIRYTDAGNGKTRVEEYIEGYSKETLPILEGFAKRYTKDLHNNWMKKYHEAL